MLKKTTKRNKPLYKKFIALRANVQYRKRLLFLKFKKKKWERLIFQLKKQQNRRKKKFKTYDLKKYSLPRFYNPFKRKYKSVLQNKQRLSMFYGVLRRKYIKKQIKSIIQLNKAKKKKAVNFKLYFFSLIERRIDVILYRAHFFSSVSGARQYILHKHIKINNITVTDSSYQLKQGDILSVLKKSHVKINSNLSKSHLWPLPPKYLSINYKIFEIIFSNQIESQNLSILYPFKPDTHLLTQYR